MKESLIDIIKDIISCEKDRAGTGINPLYRVHCLIDGNDDYYWFTNNPVHLYEFPQLKKYGHFVPKNKAIAIKIQTTDIGSSFEYDHINEIKRRVKNIIFLENRSDFQNHSISIAGDNILYQYRNIHEFLEALQQNREDILEIESKILELQKLSEELKTQKDTAHQRGQITKSIKDLQTEYRILTQQQEDLKNITIYIRKQSEMRYALIVDPIQTRIKSQNLFDGTTIIIDGGPGTGKSTTMIHRLAYLTDTYAIDEDEKNKIFHFNLNTLQRRKLREAISTQRDWMFFSPSKLLKDYLADAMKKEGLKNTSEKVWNWKDYRIYILQSLYHLLESNNSDAPFKVCFLTGTLFYQGSGIISEFKDFYLKQFREIKSKLPKLESFENVYQWTAIAKGIEKRIEGSDNFSISQFISLFNTLESVYGNDCKVLLAEKNTLIKDLALEIHALLDMNLEVKSNIEDLFDLSTKSEESDNDDIESDDSKEDDEPAENSTNKLLAWVKSLVSDKATETHKKSEDKLVKEIQKWLSSYCLSCMNNDIELSDEHQLMSEYLLPLIGDNFEIQIRKIGELLVFEQFAQYTKGVKPIMLNGIPTRYKKFRSHLIKSKFEGCDLRLLRDVMQRKNGRELHHQEQSLLLGFINTLVKLILASNSKPIKHTFIEAYEEVARPIIGIDEATDFCACDIYAMQSLLERDYFSLTLCGDMMQRLTSHGIISWDELDGIVPNPKIVDLKTSYRQSKKLLEVARQIYIESLDKTPTYKAYMKSNKVPTPLVCINENESFKIDWISKRISEIYRAYGEQLPSIAIFVNDKGYIPKFTNSLQEKDFFKQNGIKVLDGTSENTKNPESHICVYPIEVVKGMEFDVVFFHNIDNSSADMDILKRYIYVGVSRAAFFLAITLSENNHEISKYFEQNKDWFKI